MKMRRLTMGCIVVSLLAVSLSGGFPVRAGEAGGAETMSSQLPLTFVENRGQVDARARYYLPGAERDIWLAEDAIWVTLHQLDESPAPAHSLANPADSPETTPSQNLKISFPGANPHPRLEPIERLNTRVSYFIDADPAKWHTDIPVWGGVRYVGLYPGVDLEVSGQSGAWQWRVRATPGAALNPIRIQVEGADGVALEGDLLRVATQMGKFSLPLLALEDGVVAEAGARLAGNQVLLPFTEAQGAGSAAIPAADRPDDLLYATFLGGAADDHGRAIAVDSGGNAYVTGGTICSDFPAASGPGYDTGYNGGFMDAFVVKLNAAGTALSYATFLGGGGFDSGRGIALDSADNAYVVGATDSGGFPAASGPGYDTSHNGHADAFVVKINPAGTALSYATFLGGSDQDTAYGIAVDNVGNAYVTGYASSGDFPATSGPGYDTSHNGLRDAYVVKLDAAGMALSYATFLGGGNHDEGWGIAVDAAGSAYLTGDTWSDDFPIKPGSFDTSYNGPENAFVVKLNPAGTALGYATFLGGSNDWGHGWGIAVDNAGSAYVTGVTMSSDFPAVSGPGYDTSYGGLYDAYVVKLNPAGAALSYATFLGGANADYGQGIAVDSAGSAYVTGYTSSDDFPAASGPGYDTSHDGLEEAFVVRLNPAGTVLSYATFLGGAGNDSGFGIAVDNTGSAYITGYTSSSNFPAATGPRYDTEYDGGGTNLDAFVARLATGVSATTTCLPVVSR